MIEFDPETGTAQTNGQRLAGWLDWLAACVASEYKHTAEVAAAGLELANIYCFFKFLSADGGRAQCAAVVERAAKSGAKRIMAVPDKFTEGGDEESEYARMRDGLRTLVDLAKPREIDVTIEDFGSPRNPCSRMALLLRFLPSATTVASVSAWIS